MNGESSGVHRRYNALTGEWTLVSPHRNRRPWQGQQENQDRPGQSEYDPDCYLCPGNRRAAGARNPAYTGTYVFDNDFPTLLSDDDPVNEAGTGESLLRRESASGRCRVICYSPRHDLSLGDLPLTAIGDVIRTWREEHETLARDHACVQIFENRGAMMGCSNPHPHGQVWATSFLPTVVASERHHQTSYFARHARPLLLDYAAAELRAAERVVCEQEHWLVVVPWWAAWPFETLVLPRRHVPDFTALRDAEIEGLAATLQTLQRGYDALFGVPFPYSMGWHPAPAGAERAAWQLHAHFNPPLLRSASVRKFMVGFEMFAETQRDLTPETAAARLSEVCRQPDEHR